MSKRYWLVATSVAALSIGMASAAVAGPPTPSIADGFVSLAVGGASLTETYEGDSYSANGVTIEGAASGEYNFSTTLGFQGDIVLGSRDYNGSDFSDQSVSSRSVEAAVHAFYRNNEYLLGAFGQYGNDNYTVSDYGYGISLDHFYAGGEGQVFLGNVTLYGQLGGQQVSAYGQSLDGWFGNFEARYFLGPDFRIDAHVGADTIDLNALSSGDTLNSWHAGLGAEYRFSGSPFSVFAKYDYTGQTLNGEGFTVSDNRILVGARFNFDTTTLFDRDRSGASLKPVDNTGLSILGFSGP